MKNTISAIILFDRARRKIVVRYSSGAVRTYRGRVPFSVLDFIIDTAYSTSVENDEREGGEHDA